MTIGALGGTTGVAEASLEAALSPPALVAVTLKKYSVLLFNPVTMREVPVRFGTAVTPDAVRSSLIIDVE